jgi:hypothetical protein
MLVYAQATTHFGFLKGFFRLGTCMWLHELYCNLLIQKFKITKIYFTLCIKIGTYFPKDEPMT